MTRKSSTDAWREQLVVELRLHDEPGGRIGDVLAEVDSHCADSGQGPREAFGDPVAYAASLARPQRATSTLTARTATAGAAFLAALLAVLAGADAVLHGRPASITGGDVASLVVALAGLAAVVVVLPHLARGRWWARAALAVALALPIVPQLLWRQELARLPGRPVLIVGLVLLAAAGRALDPGRLDEDRVVDPRTGEDRYPVPRALTWLLRWGWLAGPAVAVLLLALVPAG